VMHGPMNVKNDSTPFFTLHPYFALFSSAVSNKQYVDSKGKMIHDV